MPRERAFEDIEVGDRLCLRGGMKSAWTVVQTFESAGQTAFGVSGKEGWLLDHAFGKHTRDRAHHGAVQSVVDDLRMAVDKAAG
eukprot:12774768-Alexandrium_andersonii.AAC.1